ASPYRASIVTAGVLMLVETVIGLAVPWLTGLFAGAVLLGQSVRIDWMLPALLGLFAAQGLLRFAKDYLTNIASERMLADLTMRVDDHLQALPLGFHQQTRQGDVLSLTTYETSRLSSYVTGPLLSTAPRLVTALGAIVMMVRIDAMLASLVVL